MFDLLTLQNRLKRDPEGYRDEFLQQVRQFLTNLQIFKSQSLSKTGRGEAGAVGAPGSNATGGPAAAAAVDAQIGTNTLQTRRVQEFCALIAFLSHTAPLYKEETKNLNVVHELYALLSTNIEMLDPLLRKTLVQSLILLQKRGLVNRIDLYNVLFTIFKCADKELRSSTFTHIVNDLHKLSQTAPSITVTSELQRVVFTHMKSDHINVALKATHVLVELWKRNVWVGEKVVNAIAGMIFTTQDRLISAALYFFLGDYDTTAQEDEAKRLDAVGKSKEVTKMNHSLKHAKKKMKRQREIDRTKKLVAKVQRELDDFDDEENQKDGKTANIQPLIYIHDPQHFAERLFYKLKVSKETFQTRMLIMDVLSKIIGLQKLLLFNFYPFLQRYLQPHQRNVTTLLSYVIRATHNLVPPEVLRPVVKTIANGFVNDKSGPEVITVGINSIRELCSRAPLVMSEELLHDLVEYKGHKNKGIMSATRSLLNVFRELNPELLKKRDRGKEARVKLAIMNSEEGAVERAQHQAKLEYGQQYIHRDIIGADLLVAAGVKGREDDDEEWEENPDVYVPDDEEDDEDAMPGNKKKGKKSAAEEEFDWSQWEVDAEGENDMFGAEGEFDDMFGAEGEFDDIFGEGEFGEGEFDGEFGEFDFGMGDDEEEEEEVDSKSKKSKKATMNDDELAEAMLAEFGEGEMADFGEGEGGDFDFSEFFADEDAEEEEEEIMKKSNIKRAKQDAPLTAEEEAEEMQLVQIAGTAPTEDDADKYKPAGALKILTPADFKKIEILKQRQREQAIGNRRGLTSLVEDLEEQDRRLQCFREQSFVDVDGGELQTGHVKKQRLLKEDRVKQMREHKRAIRLGMVGNNNQVAQRQITTEEKSRSKVYQMVKHSRKVKSKTTQSFKNKQAKFTAHVKSLKSMRKNIRKKVGAAKRSRA